MNAQAKQMLLLASIDGTIDELFNMILVNGLKEVKCPHYKQEVALFGDPFSAHLDIREYVVELKPYGFNRERVGCIGRCSCGKIYYSYDVEHTMIPVREVK